MTFPDFDASNPILLLTQPPQVLSLDDQHFGGLMKFLRLALFVFALAPTLSLARSFDDVISQYSNVEKIQPVEFKGLPFGNNYLTPLYVCKHAGYKIVLDYKEQSVRMEKGQRYLSIMSVGDTDGINYSESSGGFIDQLVSVTCAK